MVKTVKAGETWLVEKTTQLTQLIIEKDGKIAAPEGKAVTLVHEGIGFAPEKGVYSGNVVLAVSDYFEMPPSGLFANMDINTPMRTAVCVEDGKVSAEKGIPAIVQGGTVSDTEAAGIKIVSDEDEFNGILIDGDSRYTINDAKIWLDGDGGNDFIGFGAGILTMGNADVTINNTEVIMHGVTRCTLHTGGCSTVTVNNSRFINDSAVSDKVVPAWMLGLRGTNRNMQLTDNAQIYYNNCYLKGNGWGVQSVDGAEKCSMHFRNSKIELTGTRARGYGIFAIGVCQAYFDHCDFDVNGFSILMNTEERAGYVEVTNGTKITGDLHAAMIFRDAGGTLKIADSEIETGKAAFVVKGSTSAIELSNTKISSKSGVILQLMDNDDPGAMGTGFVPPHGEVDKADPARDLTAADPQKDVTVTLEDMEVSGDFLNSTTNIRANCREVHGDGPSVHNGTLEGVSLEDLSGEDAADSEEFKAMIAFQETLQGAHNLGLTLKNAKVTGVISSATQAYREDVTFIDAKNNEEINNITQTPAPAVNNGVIVSLKDGSVWNVTGTGYLTALEIEAGSTLNGTVTVNGEPVSTGAGFYKGEIVVTA